MPDKDALRLHFHTLAGGVKENASTDSLGGQNRGHGVKLPGFGTNAWSYHWKPVIHGIFLLCVGFCVQIYSSNMTEFSDSAERSTENLTATQHRGNGNKKGVSTNIIMRFPTGDRGPYV